MQHYLATDQEYVHRLFRTNVEANTVSAPTPKAKGSRAKGKKQQQKQRQQSSGLANITFTALDWELDQPYLLKNCMDLKSSGNDEHLRKENEAKEEDEGIEGKEKDQGFDLLLSCDCIYNEALIPSFVRTCAEICRLRPGVPWTFPAEHSPRASPTRSARSPTVCIIAQQQRSPEVFEAWLRETLREFRVWRIRDEVLGEALRGGTGYLVHLLMVRE